MTAREQVELVAELAPHEGLHSLDANFVADSATLDALVAILERSLKACRSSA